MSARKERERQYRAGAGGASATFAHSLSISARTLLRAALLERHGPVVRVAANHPADNAVGSFALILAAFDVWISETFAALAQIGVHGIDKNGKAVDPREIATDGGISKVSDRFRALIDLAKVTTVPAEMLDDLALAAEARHDMIHHLPRGIPDKSNVPAWLHPLAKRDLFLSRPQTFTNDEGTTFVTDFVFADKLANYALAYWGHALVDRAVMAFIEGLSERLKNWVNDGCALNFTYYRREVPAPAQLAAYDAEHGLTLT